MDHREQEQHVGRSADPATALSHVVRFLEPREIVRVACASRQGSIATNDERTWQALCKRDFGILHRADLCSWHESYRRAWTDQVLYFDGHPDFVQYLGRVERRNANFKVRNCEDQRR